MNRAGSRISRLGCALVAILWLFATSPLNADEMRYEGRTFEDWEADLQAHSPEVRMKAFAALPHFGPRAASALIKTYRSDPNEENQAMALGALTEIEPQTSDTVRVVLEAATTDPTSAAGTVATMTIVEDEKFRSRIGPDTVPAFVEALRDANPARRILAIQLFANRLARLGPAAKQAVPTLRELADHDPEPRIRDGANAVLKLIATGVSFAAAVNSWAGTSPMSVAIGDFNGDGKQDLAVANFTSNNWKQMRSDDLIKAPSKKLGYARGDVSVLLGNGNGSFQVAVNYGAGAHPVFVAAGDFNGDGKQDLAVTDRSSNNVSILLGNGNGTFQAAVNYGAGAHPVFVSVGDFNGDGKQDLAVTNRSSNNVSILLGNGNGSFQAAVNYGAGTGPESIAVGDFNGDGKQDLAVANFTSNNVSILLGNGNGSFQGEDVNATAGGSPATVAVGDFNDDGKQDLAVVNTTSNNVSILLNNQEFSQESGGAGHGVLATFKPGGGVSYGWWNVVVPLLATIGLLVLSRVRLSVVPAEAASGEPSVSKHSAWARAAERIVRGPIWGRILKLPWLARLSILIVILTVGGLFYYPKQGSYTFTPIDVPFPGARGTVAFGINAHGQIVGYYGDSTGVHSFLDDQGVFTPIDVPFPGARRTIALGINAHGQIVGLYDDSTGGHGFLYDQGVFTPIDVPFPAGADQRLVLGINAHSQIVGHYFDMRSGTLHGFLYDQGVFTPIEVPGANHTAAVGINDHGQIVGSYSDSKREKGGRPHDFLFLYDKGVFTPIEVPFPDALTPLANGINARGQIVGHYDSKSGPVHSFLATPHKKGWLWAPFIAVLFLSVSGLLVLSRVRLSAPPAEVLGRLASAGPPAATPNTVPSEQPAPYARLACQSPSETVPPEIAFVHEDTLIGSGVECDVLIRHPSIAPQHARVQLRKQGYVLCDLKSQTGTYVNDRRIVENLLKEGWIVRLGEVEFVFYAAKPQR